MRQWPPGMGFSGVSLGPLPSGTGQSPGPISVPSWAGSRCQEGLSLSSGSRRYSHPPKNPTPEAQLSGGSGDHRLHEECFFSPKFFARSLQKGPHRHSQVSWGIPKEKWGKGGGFQSWMFRVVFWPPQPALAVTREFTVLLTTLCHHQLLTEVGVQEGGWGRRPAPLHGDPSWSSGSGSATLLWREPVR